MASTNERTKDKLTNGAKARRRYRLADGSPVPGVTTVTGLLNKPQLVRWANKLGLDGIDCGNYTDATAQVGTLAHAMIQADLQGTAFDRAAWSPDQLLLGENALGRFYEWKKRHSVEPICCETPFVSEAMRYGGTVDCYCLLDGRPTLLDFKTGKAIYEEGLVQLAAYAKLLEEAGRSVAECRILRVGRDDAEGFEERTVGERERYFAVFENLLRVYYLKKELGWR